ncbi:MAG: glutamate--tRNA ligase family protein [Pseudomonadota bacterium]|nr:glutamate--tRNA ligase family protein [Pseudomonadota bacterium]
MTRAPLPRPVGRLAPTPSGLLHLGNALAFGAAWLSIRNAGGRLLLRVEDLDRGRAREAVAAAQRSDLLWLGIDWDQEVPPQSGRAYSLDGVSTYRCTCNRAARLARACACREAHAGLGPGEGAWRFRTPPGAVAFVDRARGPCAIVPEDDPVLVRADGEAAYPLAVVIDDARDGVTEVVRGADLLDATAVQMRLYESLGRSPPSWLHVPVLLGADGRKLSKSHGSTGIGALRDAGWTPDRVWATLLPLLGLPPGRLVDARLDPARIPAGPFVVGEDGRVRS